MNKMLEFNPYFRPSVSHLLKNSYFDDIRVPKNEQKAPHKVRINVDRNEFKYDYEQGSLQMMNEIFAIE